MNSPASNHQPTAWPALMMGLFLAMGAASLLMMALFFAAGGLLARPELENSDPLSLYLLAAGTFLMGLLLLPGIYLNGRKFFGAPDLNLRLPQINEGLFILGIVTAWAATLAVGQVATGQALLSILILPFANLAAGGLPILLFLRLSLRGLEFPSARRGWSILGASLLLTPTLALFFEAIAVLMIALLLLIYASTVPGLIETFKVLFDNLTAGNASEAEITRLTASLLFAPGTSLAALSTFSLAIPIIEEIFKLTVMGFYLGRLHRSVDGFVLGILCGAAFALAENIGFTSAGSAEWVASVAARTTTALPHIFNSGLLGWALVSTWHDRRYGRLIAAFFAVTLVHGLWNAISLGMAMTGLTSFVAEVPFLLQSDVAWAAAWMVMASGTLFGLIFNNHQMRKLSTAETNQKGRV